MKHKVAELEGALLDAAVGMCEGDFDPHRPKAEFQMVLRDGRRVLAGPQGHATKVYEWSPSTDWAIGGPIIERERIVLVPSDAGEAPVVWSASVGVRPHYIDDSLPFDHRTIGTNDACATGETPLVAAMRAYVASKFGDEVELP